MEVEKQLMHSDYLIWTIGHSTRTKEEFLKILASFNIQFLVDVRRYPGSKKYPQFNVSALESYLPASGITYLIFDSLGDRRKPRPDSRNTIWRHDAFRGYADYSETEEFKKGLKKLMDLAHEKRTAYMCSESVWWRCHRAIISDFLKEAGWKVMHIMKEGLVQEHPYTSAFREIHHLNST